MGFAAAIYPSLPGMIKLHLAGNETPTPDEEEEIVTKLLEELLSFSPPQAFASGSGASRALFDE
jgi:hypothetical protein